MVWYVTSFVAILTAVAFGWISFQMTQERLTISFEVGRIWPAMAWLKDAAAFLRDKRHEHYEHSHES